MASSLSELTKFFLNIGLENDKAYSLVFFLSSNLFLNIEDIRCRNVAELKQKSTKLSDFPMMTIALVVTS